MTTIPSNHQRILNAEVYRAGRRCNGRIDREELYSEALVHYARALGDHDPDQGTLEHRIFWSVHYGLSHLLDKEQNQHNRLKPAPGRGRIVKETAASLPHWSEGLSEDATRMVRLVLSMDEVKAQRQPAKQRTALVRLLLDLGWAAARITESFREIREAL